MALDGQRILLGVTGGIAAYKAVLLLRLLKRAGADVKVVMTEAATEFVTPLTFESLSEHPVRVHLFAGKGASSGAVSPIEHIDLAKWPGLIVVAPATANSIAGFAHGRADDLLATIVSAFAGPVLLAPAMNDVMWENASTQMNLRALSERGYRVVPPEAGDLACGYEATGRMAEPETIFAAVERLLASPWRGVRVLVSAGGTEEDIDPVRVVRNRSTGRMGFAMAEAARDLGAEVTVVAANVAVPAPHGVRLVRVRTGSEMAIALRDAYAACDVLVMAAAVSDFRPEASLDHKRGSGERWTLELAPTEDILAGLGADKGSRVLIGFALETDDVEQRALAKLRRKHCDFIVVNNPLTEGAAFAHETNVVTVFDASGVRYESAAPESKREIARRVLALAQTHASIRGRAQERP
jgi:phosphopantothenoylcysteine decarboxylase/phosphopantothenate--cysteine ligase